MCFPDSGWTEDQESLLLPEPGAGPQRIEFRPLHGRLEREVEVRQRLARRQAREPQRGPDPSLLASFQLVLEQLLEQGRVPRSSLTARVRIAGRASAAKSSPSFTNWSTSVPRSADAALAGNAW